MSLWEENKKIRESAEMHGLYINWEWQTTRPKLINPHEGLA